MSFSVAIIGLPNVGKSTLFKALTNKQVDIADYPFTTIDPNIGKIAVPDKRLEKISEIIKPQKTTPTTIEFVDIAGLIKDAHKGAGLGNQFLSQIKGCDAILHVIKAFDSFNESDIETINQELLMKDLQVAEKALEKDSRLKSIHQALSEGKRISSSEEEMKEFQFLTQKPIIHLFNVKEGNTKQGLSIDLKIESEIAELSPEEQRELKLKSKLDQLISACYNILELITFFTIVKGKEARAWTVKKNTICQEAGGKVHTDFQEKFIKAEVLAWDQLTDSWQKAKEAGLVKTVGREYIVQDGDIIEFII